MRTPTLIVCLLYTTACFAQKQTADTQWHVTMCTAQVASKINWKNDTVRYRYNQMKFYVKTILPYLNQATSLFSEIDSTISDPTLSKKDRKVFVKTKEQLLKQKFEDEIKQLNETQGVLLIKLIARQTGINIHSMLSDFKSPFAAAKWQTWARLHGFNLNKKYNPIDEPWLERIMESLDYPLPEFYDYKQFAVN